MSGELLIRSGRQNAELEVFGAYLFHLLGATIRETRYSDNIPGGRYLVGESCGLRIELQDGDEDPQASNPFDFLLTFSPLIWETNHNRNDLHSFADIVARFLAHQGIEVARPLDFGKINSGLVEYEANHENENY